MAHRKLFFLLFAVVATTIISISYWKAKGSQIENDAAGIKKNGENHVVSFSDTQINSTISNEKEQAPKAPLEFTRSGDETEVAFIAGDFDKEVSDSNSGQNKIESLPFETMDVEQLTAMLDELTIETRELFDKAEWLKERGYDDEALEVLVQALELQGLSLRMSLRLENLEGDMMAQRPDQKALAGVGHEQKDVLPTDAGMENDATRELQSQIQFLNSEALRLGAIAEALTEQGDHTAAREFTIMAMEYQTEALKSDIQLETEKNELSDGSRPQDRPASIQSDESETYANEEDPADFDGDPAVAHLDAAQQNLRNDADYYYQKAEMLSDSGDEEGVREMTFLAIENQIDADLLQLEIDDIHNKNSVLQSAKISSLGRQEQF